MNKKQIQLIMGAICVFTIGLFFLRQNQEFGGESTILSLDFVLVNEDLGGEFQGVEYYLGATFVTMVNQQEDIVWHTATRSIAEAGMRSGRFDVTVILPQTFTRNLLSLESSSPSVTPIFYEVAKGHDEFTNLVVREYVNRVLNDFNQRIVRMYFSSILGNLFEAQVSVGQLTSDEQVRNSQFASSVLAPFNNVPNAFGTTVDQAQSLKRENEFLRMDHDQFMANSLNLLGFMYAGVSDNFMTTYEYGRLQQQLQRINHENVNFGLQYNFEKAASFYYNQFYDLVNIVLVNLRELYKGDNYSILHGFEQLATSFYKAHELAVAELSREINFVELQGENLVSQVSREREGFQQRINDLQQLKLMLDDFFGNEDGNQSIRNLITSRVDYHPYLPERYLLTLEQTIVGIAYYELGLVFKNLLEQNLITNLQFDTYILQLYIVRRYGLERNIPPASIEFSFLWNIENDKDEIDVDYFESDADGNDITDNYTIGDYFGVILEQLNLLGDAYRQIILIYSESEFQIAYDFFKSLDEDKTIYEQVGSTSVYSRYGDLTSYEKENLIIASIGDAFLAGGRNLIHELDTQYELLLLLLEKPMPFWEESQMSAIISDMLHPRKFNEQASKFKNWHFETDSNLVASHDSWVRYNPIEMQLTHYNFDNRLYGPTKNLYFDELYVAKLKNQSQALQALIDQELQFLINKERQLTDLSDDFLSLASNTASILADTENITLSMERFSEQSQMSVDDNTTFSYNFSQVMNNARVGGTDNQAVLDFLTAPTRFISNEYFRINQELETNIGPWILIGISGAGLIAVLGTVVLKKSLLREGDKYEG